MAVYNQVVLSPDPLYLQPKSYDARADRKTLRSLISPGVDAAGDLLVSTNNTMVLTVQPGVAYVLGQNIADQGMYRQYFSASVNVTVPAAHATLPRLDQVILRVMDNAADASGFNEARIEVVPGTATAGATLVNRNGAANLATLGEASKSVLLLCDVLVAATDTTLNAGDIADRRVRATVGAGSAAGSGTPIGVTIEWNSASSPESFGETGTWVEEDGSAISRTTYAVAFARLSTGFGVGDGSTTWNIPDSRARVAVGRAVGGHVDHDTLNDNDGLALGVRRMRHKHTPNDAGHGHNVRSNSAGGGSGSVMVVTGVNTAFADNLPALSNTTGITIGPQTGNEPTDTVAFITKRKMLRVA